MIVLQLRDGTTRREEFETQSSQSPQRKINIWQDLIFWFGRLGNNYFFRPDNRIKQDFNERFRVGKQVANPTRLRVRRPDAIGKYIRKKLHKICF